MHNPFGGSDDFCELYLTLTEEDSKSFKTEVIVGKDPSN
jgi:hypothetical protein